MANKYVDFITDEHLLKCIETLFESYKSAKADINKKKFYNNKIDIFKQTFDQYFNNTTTESIVENEIVRQVDKSYGGAIGTFHENILGGIEGYEKGNLSGYDIRKLDDTLFADIKNKHNTMNSPAMEGLYIKLKKFADQYKTSKCYWVQILAKSSFETNWEAIINGTEYRHSRVFKISGDKFYAKLTGDSNSLSNLYRALPQAIKDFMSNNNIKSSDIISSALDELEKETAISGRSISNQIAKDNFPYYSGFENL